MQRWLHSEVSLRICAFPMGWLTWRRYTRVQLTFLSGSDIDLVIVMPYELDHEAKKRSLFQLSAVLKSSLMTRSVQVVHRARVPVISFETIPELGTSPCCVQTLYYVPYLMNC